jgi:hypothetical protein
LVEVGQCFFLALVHDKKSSSMLSSTWNPWKFHKNFSLSCYQEYMHFGGSLQYQFATMFSREMMRDSARVALFPPGEVMSASLHIRNLWGFVSPWYLGGGAAQYCGG